MSSLNKATPHADVDNEITAELPVLDVAAYEQSLEQGNASTDSWKPPATSDATVQMPAIRKEALPTLQAADPALSGTHEMPAPARAPAVAETAVPLAPAARAIGDIELPPHPPLIEELRGALAAAERRIQELDERARIADAERAVAIARAQAESGQLREQLARHLESLHTAKERLGVQRVDQTHFEDEVFARGDRIATLERELAAQARVLDDKMAALTSLQQRRDALDCDAMNLRAALARRDAQIGMLEADLVARQQRDLSLHARLSDALAATDPHVPELRAELAVRDEQLHALRAQLRAAEALNADKDNDLQVAEESIRNLEIEVRDKAGKLTEANVTVDEWRAVIAETQRSILQRDSRIQQLEADLGKWLAAVAVAPPPAPAPAPVPAPPAAPDAGASMEEVALEGPARVLIRTDGNTEFLHVLGRRTRIGRGSDNELVLDTKHVSRYHAVLLAGPVHTAIEDLNSTNGVHVNGKRISRQILKDGDRITIGQSHFRFTVRT